MQEKQADVWDNANTLAVLVGGTSEDLRYLKSISLHLWLFGYELPGGVTQLARDAFCQHSMAVGSMVLQSGGPSVMSILQQ